MVRDAPPIVLGAVERWAIGGCAPDDIGASHSRITRDCIEHELHSDDAALLRTATEKAEKKPFHAYKLFFSYFLCQLDDVE